MSQETTYFSCTKQEFDRLFREWLPGKPDETTVPKDGPEYPSFEGIDHVVLYNFGSPRIEHLLGVAVDKTVETPDAIASHPSLEAFVFLLNADFVEKLAATTYLEQLLNGFIEAERAVAETISNEFARNAAIRAANPDEWRQPIQYLHGIATRATENKLPMYLLWML